jgi:hypothetical protein
MLTHARRMFACVTSIAQAGRFFVICFLMPILFAGIVQPGQQRADMGNGFMRFALRGAAIMGLQADPSGRERGSLEFIRELRPEDWTETEETRVTVEGSRATIVPLRVWRRQHINISQNPKPYPAQLGSDHTLAQTFRVPKGMIFTSVSLPVPTWHTKDSAATLMLYRRGAKVASKRLVNIVDNSMQALGMPEPMGEGTYTVELSEPKGMVGWWSSEEDQYPDGEALADGRPVKGDRALLVDTRQDVGPGTLRLTLENGVLQVEAEFPASGEKPFPSVPWRWKTSWTKAGYECTPKVGVVFSRFFTDNQRYMPVQQLKRRKDAGLSFDGARRIEMEGNRDADLRLECEGLHLHWEMTPKEMSLRFDTPLRPEGSLWKTEWSLAVLPRKDSVPASFPRFALPDARLTEDLNRFWWERAFTYPAPAGPAAWFEWMALIRGWLAGPARIGEMNQLRDYPITAEGYVHTWGATIGWPFPESPPYDTRHFDTNARYILACWRYYLWTGDREFLKSQAERLRRAMRYQLDTLKGRDGLIVTASKDVTGRHKAIGDNYWDILPFGHLDAYANAVFYGSLTAIEQMEKALGQPPLTDYAALRRKVHARYDEVFWDETKGRYIGCVDIDGNRHDYGFTFVNMEALYYGLGNAAKARRIYHWMETEPTSTGKADTYSKWIFAPRANTLHNPPWNPNAQSVPTPNAQRPTPPSWWMFGWTGTPYGDQCQDGGAILYTSFFDLMDRTRLLNPDNAWKRFMEIMARYRMPDRLCGGPPLYRGENPQQENPGSVGVDLPFPESGLVPCYVLYGVMGVEAAPEGLRVTPRLPAALPFAEVRSVNWHGATLNIRVTRDRVEIVGAGGDGRRITRAFRIEPGGSALFTLP